MPRGAASGDLISFCILGPLEVRGGDGAVIEVPGARRRALLLRLLLAPNRLVSAERLREDVWGGEAARTTLASNISWLRRRLGEGRLRTGPGAYSLVVAPGELDADRFDSALAAGRRAFDAHDHERAVELLSEALGYWRGPALADLAQGSGASWATGTITRLEEERAVAAESLLESRLALGHHQRLVPLASAAVDEEPLREQRWATLMLALYRSGRQAEAIRAFRRLQAVLGEELGIEPSSELVALEEAIVLQKPELEWTPPLQADGASSAAVARRNVRDRGDTLPSGVVTFCFTEIADSSLLLARLGSETYRGVLEDHRVLLREAARSHGGIEVKTEGDGMLFAFHSADQAVVACCEAQRALLRHPWPTGAAVQVRMGLHTGEGTVTSDWDYLGRTVHQAARVMEVAHGGQVLVSSDVLVGLAQLDQIEFRNLGEFFWRGFEHATRLHQVCHPALPSNFPPPRAPSEGVHNLVVQRTSFVGRDDELGRLADLLRRASLVTIVGPGGIGKTRLAAEGGRRMVAQYPAGVWLVSLTGLSDERLLISTVATALDVSDRGGGGIEEAVIHRLSGAACLLIMDNCEHLLGACAELVARWMRACPELTVLATSREGLGLAEEHVFRLSSLSEAAAVTLLAQRAAQARVGFVITAANLQAMSEICRRLDGIPLALELAAARLASFSPAQVADRLADAVGVLDMGRRDEDARHRTLRAAVDWSYQLLDVKGRATIRRLAVFRGGFSAAAAEEVADTRWEVLGNLVSQSLVEVDPDIEDPRFRLLEPVRQYAWSLASAVEREETQQRHAAWVVRLARQASTGVLLDHAQWAERLQAEHANIEAAIGWSLDKPDGTPALMIVGYLGYYWFSVGHFQAMGWIERALDRADQAPPRHRARALLAGATLLQLRQLDDRPRRIPETDSQGFQRSAVWARESSEIFREEGSRRGLAWALFWAARALYQFDEASARKSFAEALQLFRDLDDPLGVCWCLAWAAQHANRNGRWAEAEALCSECLQIGRATGVDYAVGSALVELGQIAVRAGDYRRALELTGEAVTHYRRVHDQWQLCVVLGALSHARYTTGDLKGSSAVLLEALDLAEVHGFYDRIVWIFRDVALLLPDDQYDLASRLWIQPPEGRVTESWPDPSLDRKRERLGAPDNDSITDVQALRARIPLARDALARMGAEPTEHFL